MYLRAKILLFPALPVLAVLAFTSPASATSATSVAGAHQQPLIHVPRFPAGPRASTVRPSAVTGTESNTYVGTKGTDTGTCPKTAPCATITYAESQTASSGTIHIADGTYNQSADLTQPVHLLGASESKVIIDGTNVDYTADGYYGLLAINNTSGTAGTIAISNLTVTHPFITMAEANEDQSPIDVANFDQTQAGDKVNVNAVTLGPADDEADFPGIGYYSLNALSTTEAEKDSASGMYEAYFTEGSGGSTRFVNDTASKLTGDTFEGTYYPAVGVFALADTSGSLSTAANYSSFTGYNGWGIVGEAGYANGNCTAPNICTGGLTVDTTHNSFNLTAAPAGSGVAAIQAVADANDSLTGAFSYSSGKVVSPDAAVSVVNDGGTVSVTDTHNTIKVTH
jgi:hypothetical protein